MIPHNREAGREKIVSLFKADGDLPEGKRSSPLKVFNIATGMRKTILWDPSPATSSRRTEKDPSEAHGIFSECKALASLLWAGDQYGNKISKLLKVSLWGWGDCGSYRAKRLFLNSSISQMS